MELTKYIIKLHIVLHGDTRSRANQSSLGIRVRTSMRVVISKVLADKATFETRLEGGLRDSRVGAWGTGITGRGNSMCKGSWQEDARNPRNTRTRAGNGSKGSVRVGRPLRRLRL